MKNDLWQTMDAGAKKQEIHTFALQRGIAAICETQKDSKLGSEEVEKMSDKTIQERQADLIQQIRERVVNRMHTDDGGYDSTAEDIRKMLIAFDRRD